MNTFYVEFVVEAEQNEGDGLEEYFASLEITSTLKEISLYNFLSTVFFTEDSEIEEKYQELNDDIYQTLMQRLVEQRAWDYCETLIIDDLNFVNAVDASLEDDTDEEGDPHYTYEYPDNCVVTEVGTYVDGKLKYEDQYLHSSDVIKMVS